MGMLEGKTALGHRRRTGYRARHCTGDGASRGERGSQRHRRFTHGRGRRPWARPTKSLRRSALPAARPWPIPARSRTTPRAGRWSRTAWTGSAQIDIVVHTAGILRDRMIFNLTEDEWDSVTAVHLKGAYNVIHPATQQFRQQRSGRIIAFSSTSALGAPGQPQLWRGQGRDSGPDLVLRQCADPLQRDRQRDHAFRRHADD